ncbi:MAG: hypothetical protein MJ192_00350 [Clostridia bacterium]|nr:hypothetical protein [Clostridia bacterium]
MKLQSKDILNAMTDIGPDLVEEAARPAPAANKSKTVRRVVLIAACVALLAAAVVGTVLLLNRPTPVNDPVTDPETDPSTDPAETIVPAPPVSGDLWVDTRAQKQQNVTGMEGSIEFAEMPWHRQPLLLQYSTIEWKGTVYNSPYPYTGDPVSDDVVSSDYETGTASAVDEEGETHTIGIRVYAMTGAEPPRRLFVRFDGYDLWVGFRISDRSRSTTSWGELLTSLKLPELMPLTSFNTPADDKGGVVTPAQYFKLSGEDSDTLRAMLTALPDVPETVSSSVGDKGGELYHISANAPALGIRNCKFVLYADGWIVTDIENIVYNFEIGPEAVWELADFLAAHGTPTEHTYSRQTIIGTVTAVGEGWLKLNDAISLENPDEAMEFTVLANGTGVYYGMACMRVGMTVMVIHEGILAEEPTVVRTAVDVNWIRITSSGGNPDETVIYIPE